MEFVAFISGLESVITKLATIVNRFYNRLDIEQDNRYTLHRLDKLYKDAVDMLRRYADFPYIDAITTTRLSHFKTLLHQNIEKLENWETKVKEAIVVNRVMRMKQVLDQCETDASSFFQFLSEHVSPALKEAEDSRPGEYLADYNVPRNSPQLILDYCNPVTFEGKVKKAILDRTRRGIVSLVISGKGGVGKSCALRGLATDPDIKKRFPGGTLYIQLGNQSSISTIIQRIARIVRRTGGPSVTKASASVRNLQDVCDEASLWFRPHTVLLLVDDIWWVNGIHLEVVNALCSILSDDSRIVFTSRDKRFADGADSVIWFSEAKAQSELARRMLMRHAAFESEDPLDETNEAAIEAILDMCQGLHLALGIAGASVRKNLSMKRAHERQNAWSEFYEDLVSKRKDLIGDSPSTDKLSRIVDISLEVLEKRNDGRDYQQLFRALCVVGKKQRVPVHMLGKLWDLEDISHAEEVAELFDTVSVVEMLREHGIIWIQLHDLILDIAIHQASEAYETQKFFRNLIQNYVPKEGRQNPPPPDQESEKAPLPRTGTGHSPPEAISVPFWKMLCCIPRRSSNITKFRDTGVNNAPCSLFQAWWNITDDGYLHENLCRGLIEGGYHDELMWLLSKPQWIVKRLLTRGIHGVEQDLEYGVSVARNATHNEVKLLKHLEMVGKAARMSCTLVEENAYEVWFQLYGRLALYAKNCNRTQAFVDEIERCAPRPWAKASLRFLQPAGGNGIDLVNSPGKVLCLSEVHDHKLFVWRRRNVVGVTQYNLRTGTRNTRELRVEEEADNGLSLAFCAAFSPDMKSVATGHVNGRIVIWDTERASVTRTLTGHNDAVWCVAFSHDGSRLASASNDHTVRLWDMLSKDAVTQHLVGHTDAVWSVAFSADGTRVASGSDDRTVLLWDTLSGRQVARLVGHTNKVRCVAYSGDAGL